MGVTWHQEEIGIQRLFHDDDLASDLAVDRRLTERGLGSGRSEGGAHVLTDRSAGKVGKLPGVVVRSSLSRRSIMMSWHLHEA